MYGINEATRDARRHVLTRTEELRLHADYLAGDHAAGRRLVNSFLPALSRVASAYGMLKGHGDDMLGVAVQAFMENLHRYDPNRDCRIWTYMQYVVRNAIGAYASANRTFFRTTQADRVALAHFEAEKKKLGASGRQLTGGEARHLAAVFGVPESIVHGLDDDMDIMRPGPINGEWMAEAFAVEDPDREGSHLDFERRHDHDLQMRRLDAGLERLDDRQREILARRFKETPNTLQDLADDMGVSRERIRQIEGIALRILRHAIDDPGGKKVTNAFLVRRYDGAERVDTRTGGVAYVASVKRPTRRKAVRRHERRGVTKETRRREAVAAARMHARP